MTFSSLIHISNFNQIRKNPIKGNSVIKFLFSITFSLILTFHSLFSQDTIKYIFAETFENIPGLSFTNILDNWQVHMMNYMESSQSLVNVGGEYGNVWHSIYHQGMAAGFGDDGFTVDILVGEYNELWFESDLYADPNFDPYSTGGMFSGKMLHGFAGGNENLDDDGWALDTTINGNGWTAHGVWGSNFELRPYIYSQLSPGPDHQLDANLKIPTGYWIHITRRVKMNTPGKRDGIYELYINDELRAQDTTIMWRSYFQGEDYGKISALRMTYFFGGSGPEYASSRDNFIRMDNLCAYYYTPEADSYLEGPAPPGHRIPRNIPDKDIRIKPLLFNEVFTSPSDTIQTHYNCGSFAPTSKPKEIIKKEIVRSEGPIRIKFLFFDSGFDSHDDLNTWTKVYSGIGENKVLLYTFKKGSHPDDIYTIENNELTIEYYSGYCQNKGWKAYYTSITHPPPIPVSLTASEATPTSIKLTWSTNNTLAEDGFKIYRSMNPDGDYELISSPPSSASTYTDEYLIPDTTYYYRIKAYNYLGESDYSNEVLGITPPWPIPETPSSLRITQNSETSSLIMWNDNSDNEDGFELEKSIGNSDNFDVIASIPSDGIRYVDVGLIDSVPYYYRLRAFNIGGYSRYTKIDSIIIVKENPPQAPSLIDIAQIQENAVQIFWNDNSDNEDGFELEKSIGNTDNFNVIASIPSDNSSYIDVGLTDSVTYYYRLRAFNNGGYSSYTEVDSIMLMKEYLPQAPSSLINKESTLNSITVQWKDNSNNESGFLLTRTLVNNPSKITTIELNANDTIYIDTNLIPSTIYSYTIDAVNEAGISPSSNAATASTLSFAENKRIKEGLIAYYNFYYDPNNIISDISGYKDPLNLRILNPDQTSWQNNNALELCNSNAIVSEKPALKIIDAIKLSKEITLECWIRPSEPDFYSDCGVITLGADDADIGFQLNQRYSNPTEKSFNYTMRVQTEYTNESGYPELPLNQELDYINLQHLLYVRDKEGNETIYVNGNILAEGFRPSGFDSWKDNYLLSIGNTEDLSLSWEGTLHLVAIYNFALSDSQVKNNYLAGPNDNLSIQENNYKISVSPNPATRGEASLEIIPQSNSEFTFNSKFRILNIYGDILYEEAIFDPGEAFTKTMNFSHYSKGIYFIQVISSNYNQTRKFVIF